jgi:hypothetical protein
VTQTMYAHVNKWIIKKKDNQDHISALHNYSQTDLLYVE